MSKQWKRVNWRDATLNRPGWQCHYATVGTSLRSLPFEHWNQLGNCWIAVEDRSERTPTDAASAVAASMRKVLLRGAAAPMHADAEAALVDALNQSPHIVTSQKLTLDNLALTPADFELPFPKQDPRLDPDLAMGSSAEESFAAWVVTEWPQVATWMVPQPSYDLMVKAGGGDADERANRRCDFLLRTAKGPLVVEVDGQQHEQQRGVDTARDRMLKRCGIEVARVAAHEASAQAGGTITELNRLMGEPVPQDEDAQSERPERWLVWGAAQTHRLAFALCEALRSGTVSGSTWAIRVEDQTGMSMHCIGPYLEMLDALNLLWGDGQDAPTLVLFDGGAAGKVEWRRKRRCCYEKTDILVLERTPTVSVSLQLTKGPSCDLPDSDDTIPRIVVRSCYLPWTTLEPSGEWPSGKRTGFQDVPKQDRKTALECLLRGIFNLDELRDGQLEAITEALNGRDCAVLLPTGAGKSLIYQLAGLCMPGRTLVVDPLVSLIDDQVDALTRHGIDRAVGISMSNNRLSEAADAYFVFVTPQRFQREPFRRHLQEQAQEAPINLTVVDEAHCVSEWGHNFMPAYLNLGRTLRRHCEGTLGVPPILALTGTASQIVLTDVLFQLGIQRTSTHTLVKPFSFDRPELAFHARRITPADAWGALSAELRTLPARLGRGSEALDVCLSTNNGDDTQAGIVFCTTVGGLRGTEKARPKVQSDVGPTPIGCYWGGNRNSSQWNNSKKTAAAQFKENQHSVMLATKSFGMGIDKPNVRWVVHLGMPASIEGYYQEAGRSGRDGKQAHCSLLLVEQDALINRNRLQGTNDYLPPVRPVEDQDDIDTAMYFHGEAFPPPHKELERLMAVYDSIKSGQLVFHLIDEVRGLDRQSSERALHRLAVLGVVDDYTLQGAEGSSEANVTLAHASPQDVEAHLVAYMQRLDPSQAKLVVSRLAGGSQSSERDVVQRCARALIEFVYSTIKATRKRSLREMWLLSSEAADKNDGEILRQGILSYLTEGQIAPKVQRLALTPFTSFKTWCKQWEAIANTDEAREWCSASARLLSSYPDHPGLLMARGITEALLPGGNRDELAADVKEAYRSASHQYQCGSAEMKRITEWLFDSFVASSHEALQTDAISLSVPTAWLINILTQASREHPASQQAAEEWIAQRWQTDRALAVRYVVNEVSSVPDLLEASDMSNIGVTPATNGALAPLSPADRARFEDILAAVALLKEEVAMLSSPSMAAHR